MARFVDYDEVTDPEILRFLNSDAPEDRPSSPRSVQSAPKSKAKKHILTPDEVKQWNDGYGFKGGDGAANFATTAPEPKPFLEEYGTQLFIGGVSLSFAFIVWWTFTRRPPLRNNVLIGGATIGAFCLNPIAGAIVLAAWIFKAK